MSESPASECPTAPVSSGFPLPPFFHSTPRPLCYVLNSASALRPLCALPSIYKNLSEPIVYCNWHGPFPKPSKKKKKRVVSKPSWVPPDAGGGAGTCPTTVPSPERVSVARRGAARRATTRTRAATIAQSAEHLGSCGLIGLWRPPVRQCVRVPECMPAPSFRSFTHV